jgi:hypothetical protein
MHLADTVNELGQSVGWSESVGLLVSKKGCKQRDNMQLSPMLAAIVAMSDTIVVLPAFKKSEEWLLTKRGAAKQQASAVQCAGKDTWICFNPQG